MVVIENEKIITKQIKKLFLLFVILSKFNFNNASVVRNGKSNIIVTTCPTFFALVFEGACSQDLSHFYMRTTVRWRKNKRKKGNYLALVLSCPRLHNSLF